MQQTLPEQDGQPSKRRMVSLEEHALQVALRPRDHVGLVKDDGSRIAEVGQQQQGRHAPQDQRQRDLMQDRASLPPVKQARTHIHHSEAIVRMQASDNR